jgi:hypothetical protein
MASGQVEGQGDGYIVPYKNRSQNVMVNRTINDVDFLLSIDITRVLIILKAKYYIISNILILKSEIWINYHRK